MVEALNPKIIFMFVVFFMTLLLVAFLYFSLTKDLKKDKRLP